MLPEMSSEVGFLHLPFPALRLDPQGVAFVCNRMLEEQMSGPSDDPLPERIARTFPWLDDALSRAIESEGYPCSIVYTASDGSSEQALFSRLPELTGGGWMVVLSKLPISSLENEQECPQIFNSLPDSVCVVEPETYKILSVNQAFQDKFNQQGDIDPVGRTCHEATHGSKVPCSDAEQHCALQEVVRTGQLVRKDVHTSVNGQEQVFETIASPLKDLRGDVSRVVYILRDVTERSRSVEEIHQLSNFDKLTGLPNRVLFLERLRSDLDKAIRESGMVAVIFLDLDRFKGINDTLGHAIGDQLLMGVSQRLSECLRKKDLVARVGGDEFVVILPNLDDESVAEAVVKRSLETLSEAFDIDGQEVFCTVSIGLAFYPHDGQDEDALLKNAEFAMYQAKEKGRNTWQRFSLETNAGAVEKLVLETGLRHALERNELFLHYQPQVLTEDGSPVGAEALCRWQHPYLGLVPPMKFIPIAEETGLILEIGNWVLREACRQSVAWRQQGLPAIRIGINLSGRQFKDPKLVDQVAEILKETDIDPTLVELELTESMLMDDASGTAAVLQKLRLLGVHLAIDDFGTGYSSLSYLKHFPIDRVKIDRSFVMDIETDADDAAIAGAIIAMSHSLKLDVIAEGVETEEQLKFLRERNCDEIQGYYFGKPMAAEDFANYLQKSQEQKAENG